MEFRMYGCFVFGALYEDQELNQQHLYETMLSYGMLNPITIDMVHISQVQVDRNDTSYPIFNPILDENQVSLQFSQQINPPKKQASNSQLSLYSQPKSPQPHRCRFLPYDPLSLIIIHKFLLPQKNMQITSIKPSRYRYINLILFLFAGFCNSISTQAFSAIGPLTRNLYQVSELEVNIVSMCNSILYPFILFPSNYIVETFGLKIGTLTGQMLICLGLVIRLLINTHFSFFIIGTYIAGLGVCFMLCSPNKFVVNWFPVNQISIMNALCIFSIFMSDSLGTFASAAFLDKNSTKEDFFDFFAAEAGVIVGILLMMAIFFRGQPQNPPNYASQIQRESYRKSFKALIKNKNYLKLFSSMSFIFGALNIFFVCLSWILQAYKFESIQTGIIFIVANISGMAGCVITGLVFSNRSYRRNCIFYIYACIVALLIILLGLEIYQPWVLYVGGGVFGFNIFPYLTTMTDFASQTSFPVGEAISGGSLLFGGQILGVASALLMTVYVFDGVSVTKTRIGAGIILVIMILGVICLHFSQSILKRTRYEQMKTNPTADLLTETTLSE